MSPSEFLSVYYVLWALLALEFCWIIRLEYKTHSVAILFWAALAVVYLVPAAFDPLVDGVTPPIGPDIELGTNPALLRAELFALGFGLCYLLGRALFYPAERRGKGCPPAELPVRIRQDPRSRAMLVACLTTLAAALTASVYAIVSVEGIEGLIRGTYLSYRDESIGALKLAGYYGMMAASGAAFLAWSLRRRGASLLCLATITAGFLLGRTRQLFLPALSPFLMLFVHRQSGVRGLAKLATAAAVLYGAMLFLLVFRHQGDLASSIEAITQRGLYDEFMAALSENEGEAVLRYGYYYFIDEQADTEGFGTGQTYRRLAILPIPSSIAGSWKPQDFAVNLFVAYYGPTDLVGPTYHPLMYGDAYANLGWPGMLLGLFWAVVFGGVNLALHRCPPVLRAMLFAPLGLWVLMAARGAVYAATAAAFWGSLIACGLFQLSQPVGESAGRRAGGRALTATASGRR